MGIEWDVNRLVVGLQELADLKKQGNSPPASAEPRSAAQLSQEPLPLHGFQKHQAPQIDALLFKVHQFIHMDNHISV